MGRANGYNISLVVAMAWRVAFGDLKGLPQAAFLLSYIHLGTRRHARSADLW